MDNEKDGPYSHFDINGNRFLLGSFQKDRENGSWTEFYPDGKKKWKGNYVNGQKAGRWVFFDTNGKVERREKFDLDPLQASW